MNTIKNAILVGSSGLVGSAILQKLLANDLIERVHILVRSKSGIEHPKLNELICDFNDLTSIQNDLVGEAVFFCVGTTRKKTPKLDEYRKIDCGIVQDVGRIALANGARQAHLISAVGADASSSNFYLKIKGEAETTLRDLNFEYICLYRPAMLIGKRKEKRFGERIGQLVSPFFDFFMGKGKFHSIKAETLANSMLWNALKPMKGVRVLHYRDMIREKE